MDRRAILLKERVRALFIFLAPAHARDDCEDAGTDADAQTRR